jgi:cation diffusion facilitator CzcD-associated flavoprotein CzcO
VFPTQKEILAYIRRIASTFNIPERTKLQTEWLGATWVESSATWHIRLRDLMTDIEYVHEAKVMISAVGGFTNPKYPQIPGLDSFEGTVVHTAEWNKPYSTRGLNVAVVGGGCLSSLPILNGLLVY